MNLFPVEKLKWIARLQYGDSLAAEDRVEGTIPVFGSNGIVGMHDKANTLGPAVIVGRKGSFGKLTYTEAPCFCIDTAYYVDRRCTKAHLRWLFYALQCAQLDAVSLDTGVPGLSREIAHSSPVPVPSASDQIRIADFLDKETTKIDKLIAKKRQLTKLLSEERNEEVRRATVEGIRQSELQTTPFAWLGGVPSRWTILP